jgi:nucleoside 2-deoxyribosyltransferase
MYEVGYADALGKPVVVINQDVNETPFDLKVHRQITYKPEDLPTLTARVEAFARTALTG